MTIEKIKDWIRKHKKGIILAVGGAAATTIGVKVFRDHYYIVSTKNDMITLAKDSVINSKIPDAIKQIGDVDLIWENSKLLNTEIYNVTLDKFGEVGKAVQEAYEISGQTPVEVLMTIMK